MLGEQRQQRLAGNGPAHGRRREQQRRGGRADPQEPRHGPRPGGLGGPQQGRRPFGCGSRQHPTWHGAAPCPPPSETPLRAGSRRRLRHRPAERHRPRREERDGTATRSFGAVRRKPRRGGSGQLRGGGRTVLTPSLKRDFRCTSLQKGFLTRSRAKRIPGFGFKGDVTRRCTRYGYPLLRGYRWPGSSPAHLPSGSAGLLLWAAEE